MPPKRHTSAFYGDAFYLTPRRKDAKFGAGRGDGNREPHSLRWACFLGVFASWREEKMNKRASVTQVRRPPGIAGVIDHRANDVTQPVR